MIASSFWPKPPKVLLVASLFLPSDSDMNYEVTVGGGTKFEVQWSSTTSQT